MTDEKRKRKNEKRRERYATQKLLEEAAESAEEKRELNPDKDLTFERTEFEASFDE